MRRIIHGYSKPPEKKLYAIHPGSWYNLPDLGITEAIGGLFGVAPNQQGGSNLSGRSIVSPIPASQTSSLVKGSGGTAGGFGTGVLGAATSNLPPASTPVTSNTGTGGGDSQLSQLQKMRASGGLNPSQQALYDQLTKGAQSGNQATLDAIQNKLNLVRQQAQDQIKNATGSRDYLLNFINQRYPELQGRVEQQRTQTLNDLSGQQTDLQTLYDQANAQARRRSEDISLQNRNAARAGNRLGSSFYDQAVQGNQENLGRLLGASDLEKIKKFSAIDTQKNTTNQNFNNTINDLNSQKDQATYQAMDQYQKELQQAQYLEQAGINDFGAGQAQAEQNLQSRLDSIAQWAQGIAQQQAALEGQYGSGGSFDTNLGNFATQNQNFLAGNAPTPAGNNLLSYAPSTLSASPTSGASSLLGFGQQKPLTLEDILAGASSRTPAFA